MSNQKAAEQHHISQLSLLELSKLLPDSDWAQYLESGVFKWKIPLSLLELRAIELAKRCTAAELGVTMSDPETYPNYQGRKGV